MFVEATEPLRRAIEDVGRVSRQAQQILLTALSQARDEITDD